MYNMEFLQASFISTWKGRRQKMDFETAES
jgi:hypothetical protein